MSIVSYVNIFGTDTPLYNWFVGLGVAAILSHYYWQLKRSATIRRLDNRLLVAFPFAMITGVLFAFLWDAFFRETWRTWFGDGPYRFGFTYFGWLFGVILYYCIYGRCTKIGVRFLLNLYLPSFALAQAFGRVGCFLSGCCYGQPSERFGIAYPEGSLPYAEVGNVPLFPIQLVEAVLLILLFAILCRVAFRYRAIGYLFGVALERFVIELFRHDARGSVFGIELLSPGQWFCVMYFVMACALVVYEWQERRKKPMEVDHVL